MKEATNGEEICGVVYAVAGQPEPQHYVSIGDSAAERDSVDNLQRRCNDSLPSRSGLMGGLRFVLRHPGRRSLLRPSQTRVQGRVRLRPVSMFYHLEGIGVSTPERSVSRHF